MKSLCRLLSLWMFEGQETRKTRLTRRAADHVAGLSACYRARPGKLWRCKPVSGSKLQQHWDSEKGKQPTCVVEPHSNDQLTTLYCHSLHTPQPTHRSTAPTGQATALHHPPGRRAHEHHVRRAQASPLHLPIRRRRCGRSLRDPGHVPAGRGQDPSVGL